MLKTMLGNKYQSSQGSLLWKHLEANVLEVRKLTYLKQAMGWANDPILAVDHLYAYKTINDLNDRRLRDAQVLGSACRNGSPTILLEIGTSYGYSTALMAQNAPSGTVYTVNIPPEEIENGGKNISFAPSRDEIGWYYREQGLTSIKQILVNTATWEPDIGTIDVAFIDGCHDTEFVYNDTRKILQHCRPGSLILWHDFAPSLIKVYSWIEEVCRAVEQLYVDGLIKGKILHLQDSWTGLYQVPENR